MNLANIYHEIENNSKDMEKYFHYIKEHIMRKPRTCINILNILNKRCTTAVSEVREFYFSLNFVNIYKPQIISAYQRMSFRINELIYFINSVHQSNSDSSIMLYHNSLNFIYNCIFECLSIIRNYATALEISLDY